MMATAEGTQRPGWGKRVARAAAGFADPRVFIVLLLGFSSGLPLALTGGTLQAWAKESGVSLAAIGLFSLVGLPYIIKFVWAPIVDAFDVPVLGRALGHRRGWLVFAQLLLMATVVFLGVQNPSASPWMLALAAVIVATASATQDIVIDAFRVEYLPADLQSAGMGYFISAYRVGVLVSGAGALALVDYMQRSGIPSDTAWSYGYAFMATLVIVGLIGAILAREPREREREAEADAHGERTGNPALRFARTAYTAFTDFLTKRDVWLILLFVLLYKLGEALAAAMTTAFVLDIGFSKTSLAAIVKGFGFGATILGGIIGGLLARAMPLSRALLVAGILQALANFTFSWLASIGTDHAVLTVAIFSENFTSALATVAFVTYLSALCTSPAHTATQFALLTALSAVGRIVLASPSGYIAENTRWVIFFALCAAAAVPGLVLLWLLVGRGDFAAIERKERAKAAS
jgi:PAT family beta-lactamase induction signal transducer AmpG